MLLVAWLYTECLLLIYIFLRLFWQSCTATVDTNTQIDMFMCTC